jgi:RNA polymerase sigma factor (TIGR02999 family)
MAQTIDTSPSEGELNALNERFNVLYEKIRCLASRLRWGGTNPTLNPTALANEAFLKLHSQSGLATKRDDEVIRIFANAMHQILIDTARRKRAQKRLPTDFLPERRELPIEDVITVSAALEELEGENPRQAQIVRCRFLLGMTADETATALRLGKRTVEREWLDARQRLGRKIDPVRD